MSDIPPADTAVFQTNTGSNFDTNVDQQTLEINDTLSDIKSLFGKSKSTIDIIKLKLQDDNFKVPVSEIPSEEDQLVLQEFLLENLLNEDSVEEIYPSDMTIPKFENVPQLKTLQDFPFFLHQLITYLEQHNPPVRYLIKPPVWQQKDFITNYKTKKDNLRNSPANAASKHLSILAETNKTMIQHVQKYNQWTRTLATILKLSIQNFKDEILKHRLLNEASNGMIILYTLRQDDTWE